MDRTGVTEQGLHTIVSHLIAFLQAVPVTADDNTTNGTSTANATNGTNASTTPNATQGIEEGTQRAVGLFEQLWPDPIPIPPQWLVRLGLAILVLIVAWYTSKLVVRLLTRRVARRFRRPSVVQSVLGSVRTAIMLVAVFVAAGITGFLRVGDLVLSATVLTAAIGLVLAPIITSVVNGLLILADQPYEVGDMVEFVDSTNSTQTGHQGFVEDITLRHTKIFTLDNTFIVVPNSSMRDQDVINYSAEDPRTRLRLDVLVTYEGNLREARDLIERAARQVDIVVSGGPDIRVGSARYPAAPTCYINEFGDDGVLLTLRYWAREPYKILAVRSQVQENVWAALEDADVEMAYPHTHLLFDETSGELPVSLTGDGRRADASADRPPVREAADGGVSTGRRSRGRHPPIVDRSDNADRSGTSGRAGPNESGENNT
jgi:small conductance mechanosensitive channel